MDKVIDALKCVECREILSAPIFLPCGHMICKKHTQSWSEHVLCAKCGIHHPNREFVVIEGVANMIEAKLSDFDFGEQHKQTSEFCGQLKNLLGKNDSLLNDLEYHIHEEINMLKNRVVLRGEQLKVKIDAITQEMIDDLDKYDNE